MSDTNRARLSYALESSYGVAETGTYIDLRYTADGLKQDTDTKVSDEIRFDRQDADVFRSQVEASGTVDAEVSGATLDDMLLGILCASAWGSAVTVGPATDIAATATDTFTSSTTDFTATNVLVANQWIFVSGFANAENNGFFKLSAVAANLLTVVGMTATVVESAGATVTMTMGGQIVNGTVLNSFSFERNYVDLSNDFAQFLGMAISQATLGFSLNSAVTASMQMMGVKETSLTGSAGSGYTPVNTNPVLETIDHLVGPLEGTTGGGVVGITELECQIANGNRLRHQLANVGPVSQGLGSFTVSGSLNYYYGGPTLFNKYLNFTTSALAIGIQDTATPYRYILDWPRVKFTDGDRSVGGKNQDVSGQLTWGAYRDPTEGITMRVARFLV